MLRNGRWQTMSEPINYDRPFAGVGPGASFAACWCEEHPEGEIGLIPCADGGSCLEDWTPGGQLFDHAVAQTKLAQRISIVDGILWHQGETDCAAERAAAYEEKLDAMVSSLRTELSLEHVPLILGGLGDYLPQCTLHDYFVNGPEVTARLRHYAETHENCFFVTAEGLKPNQDMLHFDAPSQRILGARYYAAFKNNASVYEPLQDEQKILEAQHAYLEQPTEKKIEMLRQQMNEGRITKQEFSYRMDCLISSM